MRTSSFDWIQSNLPSRKKISQFYALNLNLPLSRCILWESLSLYHHYHCISSPLSLSSSSLSLSSSPISLHIIPTITAYHLLYHCISSPVSLRIPFFHLESLILKIESRFCILSVQVDAVFSEFANIYELRAKFWEYSINFWALPKSIVLWISFSRKAAVYEQPNWRLFTLRTFFTQIIKHLIIVSITMIPFNSDWNY